MNYLIKEYISKSEPVSSNALKKAADLDICGATIRNDLQQLTKHGYIEQPHTSAGRVPTKKAYKRFADSVANEREKVFSDFISRQIKMAQGQIEQEMRLAEELIESLSETSSMLSFSTAESSDDLFEILNILSQSKTTFGKNINIINEIIEELENF